MKESDKCKICLGKKIVDNVKEIEVPVEPGVPHEYNYKLTGEADEGVSKKQKIFQFICLFF